MGKQKKHINKYEEHSRKVEKYIKKIEKRYNTTLICLFGELNDRKYEMFVRQMRNIDKNTPISKWIYLLLHSEEGGDAAVALKISYIMRTHKCKFRCIIPLSASSAGSQIAFSADEVVMDKYSFFTPFDTQMGGIALRNIEDYPLDNCKSIRDYHRIKEALADREISINELHRTFQKRYSKEMIKKIDSLMVNHNTSHDHPIGYQDFLRIGLTHITCKKLYKHFYSLVDMYTDLINPNEEQYICFYQREKINKIE